MPPPWGPPGTGKSHLAQAIGRAAIQLPRLLHPPRIGGKLLGDTRVPDQGGSPDLLVFRDEYEEWAAASRMPPPAHGHVTVDKADASWTGRVGLITQALAEVAPSPEHEGRQGCRRPGS